MRRAAAASTAAAAASAAASAAAAAAESSSAPTSSTGRQQVCYLYGFHLWCWLFVVRGGSVYRGVLLFSYFLFVLLLEGGKDRRCCLMI